MATDKSRFASQKLIDVVDISSSITDKATGATITGKQLGNIVQITVGNALTNGLATYGVIFKTSKKPIVASLTVGRVNNGTLGSVNIDENGNATWIGTAIPAGSALGVTLMYLTAN